MPDIIAKPIAQITSRPMSIMPDAHTSAAEYHEMAAQQHHTAAALHAEGSHDQAGQCAKLAQDYGEQAMQHAGRCCQYHTGSKNNN